MSTCLMAAHLNENGRVGLSQDSSLALTSVALLVGASSHRVEGHWFTSWSGHTPALWVLSLVGGMYERQSINVSLSHRCCSPLPSPLSKNKRNKILKKDSSQPAIKPCLCINVRDTPGHQRARADLFLCIWEDQRKGGTLKGW